MLMEDLGNSKSLPAVGAKEKGGAHVALTSPALTDPLL